MLGLSPCGAALQPPSCSPGHCAAALQARSCSPMRLHWLRAAPRCTGAAVAAAVTRGCRRRRRRRSGHTKAKVFNSMLQADGWTFTVDPGGSVGLHGIT